MKTQAYGGDRRWRTSVARWLVCVLLGLGLPTLALAKPEVVLQIVLIRHGVRSPTSAPEALAPFAKQPWPTWPVAPGMLTEHGADVMAALGLRYRQDASALGLLGRGCEGARALAIIGDSTPRNQASAASLARSMDGRCAAQYLSLDASQNNPLFHYRPAADAVNTVKLGDGESSATTADTATSDAATPAEPSLQAVLSELQHVLLACDEATCLDAAIAVGKQPLLATQQGDGSAAQAKALKHAGTLSENLMLEYVQGMPLAEVGWGRLNRDGVGRLIQAHNLQFAQSKRRMPAAAQAASNLLAHIVASLQQSAGWPTTAAALTAANQRLVMLVGHDTNLANLGGLLDLQWHAAEQPDDYPPGGALVFQLTRDGSDYLLSIHARMPSLDALRQAQPHQAMRLADRALPVPGCMGRYSCPLPVFVQWVQSRLDSHYVDKRMPDMHIVAVTP